MGVKITKLPKLNPSDLTDRETLWLQIIREMQERIQELTDEIARLKNEKEKPKIKPSGSRLEPKDKENPGTDESIESSSEENSDSEKKKQKKRPGSAKRKKTAELPIHETKIIEPFEAIPPGSEFKGYQDYTVIELIIKPHNIRYRLARWKTPTGEYLRGKLPKEVLMMGHFGPTLKSYLLYRTSHGSEETSEPVSSSIPSLSCHPTQTTEDDGRLGHRPIKWAVKPNFGRRQRKISHRKAGDPRSRPERIKLHQH